MNGEIEYTGGLSLQTINYGSDQVISNNTFINLSHKTLWDAVADVGASHTAEQQYERGECLEGTRVEHRRIIHEWAQAGRQGSPLFWLTGAAGVGKTAIAMSAAKACEQEGLLVSSFFFSRSDLRRNNPQSLWLSVAHGLSSKMPGTRHLIEQRISKDPKILQATMEDQFRELVCDPITRQSGLWSFSLANAILSMISTVRVPSIVIIDGFDECGDEATQLRILRIIRDAVQQSPPIPLRFLICSRPESWIREAFTSGPFRGLLEVLPLDDEFGAAEDITKYFRHHFQEIVSNPKYKHILFPDPWPSQEDLETLLDRSCNQFLYVKSVVRLITLASNHPVNELRLILDNSPTNRHTLERLYYPELDGLYHTILAATPYREKVHTILVAILVLPTIKYPDIDPWVLERYLPPTPAHIELLLGLSEGQVVLMLRGMHSVLRIGGQTDEITLHHTSFRDFLVDQIRSGYFHIDLAAQKHIVAQRWLETLTTNKMLVSSSDLVADAHEDVSSFEEVNTEEDFDDDEGTYRLELNLDEEMFYEPVNETDDGDDSESDSTSEDLPPTTPPGEAQKYEEESLSNSDTHCGTISEKAAERTSPTEVTGPAEGIRADEESERVQAFFKDDTKCRNVLDTRGDEAQRWLDLLQALTAYPEITKQSRSTIFKIMWRLSKKSRMYPKCLKINNVKKLDEYPVAAGGMGDVYKGEIAAEIVCLKVVKVYQTSDVQQGINEFMQEAIVWQQLRHPNILPF
ncbi:hypothetical protein AAF712_015519, partial [Marasmius tenuissimus]